MAKNVLSKGDIALIVSNTGDKNFDYSVGLSCTVVTNAIPKFILEHGEERLVHQICLLNQPTHWQPRIFDVQPEELLKLCSDPERFNTNESCLE